MTKTEFSELRKNCRESWLGSIEEMSDYETQCYMWLHPKNINPHFSYVEYCSCYFDDLDWMVDNQYARGIAEGYVTKNEFQAVENFHDVFEAYEAPVSEINDDRIILDDPAWKKVVVAAEQAKAKLLKILEDQEEISILLGTRRAELIKKSLS